MPCQNHEKALQCLPELCHLHPLQPDKLPQRLQNHMPEHHRYTLQLKDYWHPERLLDFLTLFHSALLLLPSNRSTVQSHL